MGTDIRKEIYLAPKKSNIKLGDMYAFGLEEGKTCPGKTEFCEICYGKKGAYKYGKEIYRGRYGSLENYYSNRNLRASMNPDFVPVMIEKLKSARKKGSKSEELFRIHPTGDFYNPEYIKKWEEIVKNSPDYKFGAYTRSWRVKRLREELENLRKLPNINLMASTDPTSGKPPEGWKESGIGGGFVIKDSKLCKCEAGDTTCKECKHCYNPKEAGVVLNAHSLSIKDIPKLNNWETVAVKKGEWMRHPEAVYKVFKGREIIPMEYVRKGDGTWAQKVEYVKMPQGYGAWSKKHKSTNTISKVSRVR